MKRTDIATRSRQVLDVVLTSDILTGVRVSAVVAAVSLAAVLLRAPVELRVCAVAALLVIPAWAAAALILGKTPGSTDTRFDGLEKPLRVLLPALFTLIILLETVLALGPLGFQLTTSTIALALFAVSAVMLSLLAIRIRQSPRKPESRAAPDVPWRRVGKTALVSLALTALCVGALIGALAMQTTQPERYVNTILTGPDTAIAGQLAVTPGSPVDIEWTSYSYGFLFPTLPPDVSATIGGVSPTDPRFATTPPTAPFDTNTNARSAQVGTVSFLAPNEPGRYRVAIDIAIAQTPDTVGVGPTSLVLYLSVAP
ncbi:hypothetical protein R4P64_27935 [Rhodococcus sp. IEGM 1366]|uniref:hypothetical protein n=1 Tax=Rhodococcus sp. IEGM 1366 TaxID=3082223 RepID=UPI0029534FF5|nr:hypothetical protein [Rhodococcus sp. IEGM 1366]MDV8070370.1 hypothetical protein [Rhodococcus sp. IEGM 1366]